MLRKIGFTLLGFFGLRIAEWLVLTLAFLLSVYFPPDSSLGQLGQTNWNEDIPTAFALMAVVIIGYGYVFISAAAYLVGIWMSRKNPTLGLAAMNALGFACFATWFILAKLPNEVWAPWVVAIVVTAFNWFSGRLVTTWLAQRDVIRAL